MRDQLRTMLADARQARTFEDAAWIGLGPILERAAQSLAESRFATSGGMVRATLHLRSDDAYRALAVREAGSVDSRDPGSPGRYGSTSAWSWLSAVRRAVAIDLLIDVAYAVGDPGTVALGGGPSEPGTQSSLHSLRDTGTTHLLVLPLWSSTGELAGMVSIEARCRTATGTRFVWDECAEELQVWCDVIGPIVSALPPRPIDAPAVEDPFLPVCGATMAPLVSLARVFAEQNETILLLGPTGVGKSRMARFCHERSNRRGKPFETLDLLSVPSEMQAGELVGWKRGAFTGAVSDHDGAIARAAGGTLFLDELDKLSLAAQASLLHLIEARRYHVLGDAKERRADVRFIAGTNVDLPGAVRAGRFREDLYYRIHILAVALPPLRERRDEIAAWARHMLERRHREGGRGGGVHLTAEAAKLLASADWPGNLRQLDNVLRRAYVMALAQPASSAPATMMLDEADVRGSLASEGLTLGETGLGDHLMRAARLWVERAQAVGGAFDLEMAGVLRSFVLAVAVDRTGGVEPALRLLGRENLVRNRNQHKALQRELERLRAFYAAIGETPPSALCHALGESGEINR